jgi:hypothetical protein
MEGEDQGQGIVYPHIAVNDYFLFHLHNLPAKILIPWRIIGLLTTTVKITLAPLLFLRKRGGD